MERAESLIEVNATVAYDLATPTTFILNIAAAANARQTIAHEQLTLSSAIPYEWCEPGEEPSRSLRMSAEPGRIEIVYSANVQLRPEADEAPHLRENPYEALPPNVLKYLNPSRYCESDLLVGFAAREFADADRGFSRVQQVCEWIHSHVSYMAGTTDSSSTACDVLLQRTGVCRDFAHVGIALCRALGIPARYVAGYAAALEPPDFHGLFEAFLGGRWYLFDATRMASLDAFVRIGVGRDAADVPVANIVGRAVMTKKLVAASQLNADRSSPPSPEVAISTA